MKKNIAIVTSTRAEFGILKPLIMGLKKHGSFKTDLIVTGSHLSTLFGKTETEITASEIEIDTRIDILSGVEQDSLYTSLVSANTLKLFSLHFSKKKYDSIIILGDRFEILAVAQAAFLLQIPIIHLHGGELTLGSMDDSIRHAITKLSSLHFTSTEVYKKRVIQLGEQPGSVFCSGAPGLDTLENKALSKEQLEKDLQIDLSKSTCLCTFHPVTNSADSGLGELKAFTSALLASPFDSIIFTMPNIDPGNLEMRSHLIQLQAQNPIRIKTFESLGHLKYTSLMKYSNVVAGNSSSGLLEAPFFKRPVVNIGSRQGGRVFDPRLVLNSEPNERSIKSALEDQLKLSMTTPLPSSSLYGDGTATKRILKTLEQVNFKLLTPKKFYDL